MLENPIYLNNFKTYNCIPFCDVVGNTFGRRVLKTSADYIDERNVADELARVLPAHTFNATAIYYLDEYVRGNQPILYREKIVRPEINNKIVENHAFENVESKVADLFGEPVLYALKGENDESKGEQIDTLNRMMDDGDKHAKDVERARWASICGTSYYHVLNRNRMPDSGKFAPYTLFVPHPARTLVCYYDDDMTPAFGARLFKNNEGRDFWRVWTHTEAFDILNGEVVERYTNGNGFIPIIEYPNDSRRLSDVELTILVTDAINNLTSDRLNGIDQFVNALMKFKNCEIDKDKFLEMCQLGAVAVKTTTQGYDADVDIMTAELDQSHAQIAHDDLYNNMLLVQGRPGRQENSGGDTGQAVVLRNGYYDEEKRAELRVPAFKQSERMMLRVVLNILRIKRGFNLELTDIEIKPKRNKLENMMVKAQVLQILHQLGIDDSEAIKLVNLFSDPNEVFNKSKDRMSEQFEHSVNKGEVSEVSPDGNGNQSGNVVAV